MVILHVVEKFVMDCYWVTLFTSYAVFMTSTSSNHVVTSHTNILNAAHVTNHAFTKEQVSEVTWEENVYTGLASWFPTWLAYPV